VTPWVTQADRALWQRGAAAELAAILDAHAGVPVIAWTVNAFGGGLSGRVTAPASQVRGLFTAWQQALRLDDIAETPSGDGMAVYLRARTWRNGVLVSVTATAPAREGENR
jgi:hypothetical protein